MMEATSSEARLTCQNNSVNTQGNRFHSFKLVSAVVTHSYPTNSNSLLRSSRTSTFTIVTLF
ncbi:hypothetical protein BYT27DRAFT_7191949, partial [Phlegmacium glaucopus]